MKCLDDFYGFYDFYDFYDFNGLNDLPFTADTWHLTPEPWHLPARRSPEGVGGTPDSLKLVLGALRTWGGKTRRGGKKGGPD